MTANDFATAGFIDTWMRAVVARLDQLTPGGGRYPFGSSGTTTRTGVSVGAYSW